MGITIAITVSAAVSRARSHGYRWPAVWGCFGRGRSVARAVFPRGKTMFWARSRVVISGGRPRSLLVQLSAGFAQLRLEQRVLRLELSHTRGHARAVDERLVPLALQGLQHGAHRSTAPPTATGLGGGATPTVTVSPRRAPPADAADAAAAAAAAAILRLAQEERDEAGFAGDAAAHGAADLRLEPLLDVPAAEGVPAARRDGRRGVVEADAARDRHGRRVFARRRAARRFLRVLPPGKNAGERIKERI